MADYNWYKFENTQDNANLINNAVCERWQAGIELAGGSWSGSFEDGKDSITIEEFNALETQINAKVSSYTPRGYDPDSTSQIVPGVDGWNRVEDGILKAVCTPDGVNRNLLKGTRDPEAAGTNSSSGWRIGSGGNGTLAYVDLRDDDTVPVDTGLRIQDNTSGSRDVIQTPGTMTEEQTYTVSWYARVPDGGTVNMFVRAYISGTLTQIYTAAAISGAEWQRFSVTRTFDVSSNVQFGINGAGTLDFCGMKAEVSEEMTDWAPAPEDYGYSSSTLSANPQSVEDGSDSEVAPGPVEIE